MARLLPSPSSRCSQRVGHAMDRTANGHGRSLDTNFGLQNLRHALTVPAISSSRVIASCSAARPRLRHRSGGKWRLRSMHGMAAAYYSRRTGAPGAASEDSPGDASRGRLLASPPAAGSWDCTHVGSHHSVRESQEYLRQAGATAREMLVAAARRAGGSLPLNVLRRRV
jgi:hypothetical protein